MRSRSVRREPWRVNRAVGIGLSGWFGVHPERHRRKSTTVVQGCPNAVLSPSGTDDADGPMARRSEARSLAGGGVVLKPTRGIFSGEPGREGSSPRPGGRSSPMRRRSGAVQGLSGVETSSTSPVEKPVHLWKSFRGTCAPCHPDARRVGGTDSRFESRLGTSPTPSALQAPCFQRLEGCTRCSSSAASPGIPGRGWIRAVRYPIPCDKDRSTWNGPCELDVQIRLSHLGKLCGTLRSLDEGQAAELTRIRLLSHF